MQKFCRSKQARLKCRSVDVHGNVLPLQDILHRDTALLERILKGETAAQVKADQVVLPHRRDVGDLLAQRAVTVNLGR
jgi:hypothetical protein